MIASETATTAGSGAAITSYPNSVCRFPVTESLSIVSSATWETSGLPQPIRDGGPEHGAVRVGGLLPEEHEIGALPLERLREHVARRDEIGAGGCVVGDEDCAVGAHRERLAERIERLGGAERDDDDFAAVCLLDPQRLLDRVDVGRVERTFAGAVEPVGGRVDPPCGGRVGTCFTQTAIFTVRPYLVGLATASGSVRATGSADSRVW